MEIKEIDAVLIKYVRDENRKPIGVVVAVDSNMVGWSKCCKGDKWNKDLGKAIAINRAWKRRSLEDNIKTAPFGFEETVKEMHKRAEQYFK